MRQLAPLAAVLAVAVLAGCGSREAVYKENPPSQTKKDVTVSLRAFRQESEKVAYRFEVANNTSQRLLIPCAQPPLYAALAVTIDGATYPSMPAPNELPKEAGWEHFFGISGGRGIRDINQSMRGGLFLEPGSPAKYDFKAELSKEAPKDRPWSVTIKVVDLQGADFAEFTLQPKE